MTVSEPAFSRRVALGATVAGLSTVHTGAAQTFARRERPGDGHGDGTAVPVETANSYRVNEVSRAAAGEQVLTVAGATMFAADTASGASTVFRAGPYLGNYPDGGGWIGTSVHLPVASRLVNVEFVLYGEPVIGGVVLNRYRLESGSRTTLLSAAAPAPPVIGLSVIGGPLSDIVDGSEGYEAYFYTSGTTCVCRGVRIRYRPATVGLVPIAPTRVYDSRWPTADGGRLSSGERRLVSVAAGRSVSTGGILGDLVPSSAAAIAFTVTVTATESTGYLTVNPMGDNVVRSSTINWAMSGAEVANTGIVTIGPERQFTVIAGGPGSTDFVVDVVGYFTAVV